MLTTTTNKTDIKQRIANQQKKTTKLYNKIATKVSTFHNESGENKAKARKKMACLIKRTNVVGTALTLPKTSWAIELAIAEKLKAMHFLGVEYKNETFKEMQQERLNLGVRGECYEGKLSDKIYGVKRNAYAHLIADYCGCASTFIPELDYAMNNKIVKKGGVIAATFSLVRDSKIDKMFEINKPKYRSNFKSDVASNTEWCIREWLRKIENTTNFKVVEVYEYKDTQPMVLIMLQRIA